jgi:uncharacterized protein (TIGR03435 family)
MPANTKPEFAVATIKPTRPDAPRGGYGIRGEEVTTTAVTVSWMIKLGFNVHAHQISGGPAWLDSERYDTVGKPDIPGQPNRDQMKLMIRKLLADRFQLGFHTEKKELPVYAMVVAKGGPKIAVSAGDPNDFPGIGFGREPGVLFLMGRNTGFNGVANGLQSNILDKPVVDQTGLTGRYDFTFEMDARPHPVGQLRRARDSQSWRRRSAARYLYRVSATARAEASTNQGSCRCDGDRQDREAFAQLVGITTDELRRVGPVAGDGAYGVRPIFVWLRIGKLIASVIENVTFRYAACHFTV